jgi:hypothetical protein
LGCGTGETAEAARVTGEAVMGFLAAHGAPFERFDEDHLVATRGAVCGWLLSLQRTVGAVSRAQVYVNPIQVYVNSTQIFC